MAVSAPFDLEPYDIQTRTEHSMPEINLKNPPIYPGRRFESREYSLGLTLHDQVAMEVMAYMITSGNDVGHTAASGTNATLVCKAFALADAFMVERNRRGR